MTAPWTMLHEGAPQECVWMAFPPSNESFGTTENETAAARTAWTAVAHAIADFEPVKMLVDPADTKTAKQMLGSEVELIEVPLDDAWMRDAGPTFVRGSDGQLGAVDWVFNGWGQQSWAKWDNDAKLGRFIAELAGAEVISSDLVNEGGGIHTDGEGTLLLTDTVQLDRFRNPNWSRQEIEDEFRRTLGSERFLWLPRGLHRDSQRFGTRGHIDIIASAPSSGTLIVHRQLNPEHPDFHLYAVLREHIGESTAPDGSPWNVVDLPAPNVLRDDEGWLDYSYVNHLVANDAVIACTFNDERDAEAAEILAEVYPGREIVGVDARDIFAYGGGIHCITQQQPQL